MSSSYYYYDNIPLDMIFNKTESSLNVNATGFQILGVDISNNYTPLGTTTNLKHPGVSFQNGGIDLSQLFELNLIRGNTASYTANIVSDGIILIVTSDGDISFNFPVNNMGLYMKAGGGGGEEQIMLVKEEEVEREGLQNQRLLVLQI